MYSGLGLAIGILAVIFLMGARIINEYERGVILRLGRFAGLKPPGFRWIIPFVDKLFKIDIRMIVDDIPPQDIITKDNVSVKVNAVVYFRVMDAKKALLEVNQFLYATSQLAQTTLRSILGQVELDQLLSERDAINIRLQKVLDEHTDPWGIKVSMVEIKQVDLPQEMQRAIAKQAEAERERRAKVISAEGEYQAAQKLADAAKILGEAPAALTLRYLATLSEIATENNSTTVFPVPLDFFRAFMPNMSIAEKK
jgi:regulator of protease activity HflC (stomatin/prohibitin superfamily)